MNADGKTTSAKFDLAPDMKRNLLRISVEGHWSINTADEFQSALRSAQRQMTLDGCPIGSRVVLVDARAHGVQSQDVVTRFSSIHSTLGRNLRKTAVIVASALQGLQSRRGGASDNFRTFSSEEDALAWLAEP